MPFEGTAPTEPGDLTNRFCSSACAEAYLRYKAATSEDKIYVSDYESHGAHPGLLPWGDVTVADSFRVKTLRNYDFENAEDVGADFEEEVARRRDHERNYSAAPKNPPPKKEEE